MDSDENRRKGIPEGECLAVYGYSKNIFFLFFKQFFFIWTWVLKHNKYVNIIYKEVALFIHICLHNEVCVPFNIYNHIFVHINHNTFYSDNKWCAQRFIEYKDENSNRKYKLRTGLFISWINQSGRIFNSVFNFHF